VCDIVDLIYEFEALDSHRSHRKARRTDAEPRGYNVAGGSGADLRGQVRRLSRAGHQDRRLGATPIRATVANFNARFPGTLRVGEKDQIEGSASN
jgi:hypothetical protein